MVFENKLVWPSNIPHTQNQKITRMKGTFAASLVELQKVIKEAKLKDVVVTSNINITPIKLMHSHRSGPRGVSVLYKSINNPKQTKIAFCDTYVKECDNLMVIVKALKAMVSMNKHKIRFCDLHPSTQSA